MKMEHHIASRHSLGPAFAATTRVCARLSRITVVGIRRRNQKRNMRRFPIAKERTAEEVGARPGRPTKIDVGLGCEIEVLVAKGLPLLEVAARVGVHSPGLQFAETPLCR